jgi:TonB family protein
MFENEPQINFDSVDPASASKRRLQLLFALTLLLTALVLVVLKNREFWSSALGLEDFWDQTTAIPIQTTKKVEQRLNHPVSRKTGAKQAASSNSDAQTAAVTAEPHETVLSPLRVDVTYSSGQHTTLLASNSAIQVDLPNSQQSFAMPLGTVSSAVGPVTDAAVAADRVRFTSQTVELMGRPVEPVYPPVAQREHVQGSVVLQARIGEDGTVQGLQVLSGPSILTSAALEAVKQWHFKPRLEAGKAVPTETRITVNFTISTQ